LRWGDEPFVDGEEDEERWSGEEEGESWISLTGLFCLPRISFADTIRHCT